MPDEEFVVHFFPYGNGFPLMRRRKLAENFAVMGATVVDDIWKAKYIVISETIRSLAIVATRLRVSENRLRQHLNDNPTIRCIMPCWADHCITHLRRLEVPTRIHTWYYHSQTSPTAGKSTPPNCSSAKRKREHETHCEQTISNLLSRRKLSFDGSKSDNNATTSNRKKIFSRNVRVAEEFKTLSRLHQSMPLLPGDQWKSYSFRIVAGRLLELDFEVDNDELTQKKLRLIKGFGKSVCDKIQEVINFGTIARIHEFQSDDQRQAMKNLTDIWGVGPTTARDLIARGYRTIDHVREGLRQNKLSLERNQLVGVDCYEDILDRMSRSEVEEIARMVQKVAERLFPGIMSSIMGSYRRGKENCGDVDILLCHPDHLDTIPTYALGQIIDELWNEDKIAMHLTFLAGMTTGSHSRDYQRASRHIPRATWTRTKIQPSHQSEYKFYMGCLYSPTIPGMRRRVDIKFYPYRERVFASLYFTGNGYFNRSMRLWATRVFNYKLNDHGLFEKADGRTRVMEASNEREIFNRLELVYREPDQRDSWDSLEPIDRQVETNFKMTEAEFNEDRNHLWIE